MADLPSAFRAVRTARWASIDHRTPKGPGPSFGIGKRAARSGDLLVRDLRAHRALLYARGSTTGHALNRGSKHSDTARKGADCYTFRLAFGEFNSTSMVAVIFVI